MQVPAHKKIPDDLSENKLSSFTLISEHLNKVKDLIDEQMTVSSSMPEDVNRLFEYIRNRSGKMIRPSLVLLTGACCGSITEKHIRIAAVLEMVHNATLFHDDVIDDGQRRRGRPTINSLWGNESAVLLGDFILSQVFMLSSEFDTKVSREIASMAVRICEGELRQITQKRNWQLTESEYIDIITEKSAVLFGSCCYFGAVLSDADENKVRSFSDFGLNAGIAFQIADDLLDIVGDQARTGKTSGRDIDKQKLTLAIIHYLKTTAKPERQKIISKYLECNITDNDKECFIRDLVNSGSLDYADNRAQEYIAKAVQAIKDIESSPAKATLIETAYFMANRSG